MIIGYARVSTNGQDLADQLAALETAGCVKVYREKLSGARSDRPQLAKALAALDEGDVLLVTRLDRLARFRRNPVSRFARRSSDPLLTLALRKSLWFSSRRRFDSSSHCVSNVDTPAAPRRTMRPFCRCTIRRASATCSSTAERSSSRLITARWKPRVRTHPRIAAGLSLSGKEYRYSHPPKTKTKRASGDLVPSPSANGTSEDP
jgi:hypothetical protein